MELREHRVRLVVQEPGLDGVGVIGFAVGEREPRPKVEGQAVGTQGPGLRQARLDLILRVAGEEETVDLGGDDGVALALALRGIEGVGELRGEVVADVERAGRARRRDGARGGRHRRRRRRDTRQRRAEDGDPSSLRETARVDTLPRSD